MEQGDVQTVDEVQTTDTEQTGESIKPVSTVDDNISYFHSQKSSHGRGILGAGRSIQDVRRVTGIGVPRAYSMMNGERLVARPITVVSDVQSSVSGDTHVVPNRKSVSFPLCQPLFGNVSNSTLKMMAATGDAEAIMSSPLVEESEKENRMTKTVKKKRGSRVQVRSVIHPKSDKTWRCNHDARCKLELRSHDEVSSWWEDFW